jgi:hypothetical protein
MRASFAAQVAGFSDKRLAYLALQSANLRGMKRPMRRHGARPRRGHRADRRVTEADVRALRHRLGVRPVFKRIDTCAAEFEAQTPYLTRPMKRRCSARPRTRRSRATRARS